MKKWICTLMCAALTLACVAVGETAPAATPEIIAITTVQVGGVNDPTPSPTQRPSATPTLKPESSPRAEETAVASEAPRAEETAEPTPSAAPETSAPAEMKTVRVGFEDGFSLKLPEGWRYYPLDEAMAAQGVNYCLSDADGENWLYIQRWESDCADMNELKALVDRSTKPQTSGVYNFNGTDFLVYDLTEGDVSCCAALRDGAILNFVFTPQSSADYMAVSAQIMNSFAELNR